MLNLLPAITIHHTIEGPDMGNWPWVFAGLLALLILTAITKRK